MPRVKRGNKRNNKRRRILKIAKGFWGMKSKSYRIAKQAVDRALNFAFRDRRQKKRHFRALWITRINAAARINGMSYSRLMDGLRKAGSQVDRKILADLAVREPKAFAAIASEAKAALEG